MQQSTKGEPANQRDLLRVQTGTRVVPSNPARQLEQMGFRVTKQTGKHWTVTGIDPLPELHFYSLVELGRFALNQATHDQEWLNWRPHHDNATNLSG